MNVIDVVLILTMLLAIWAGWSKGFIKGVIDLFIWLGSLVLGFILASYAATTFQSLMPSLGAWALPLGFLVSMILARILLSIISNAILRNTNESTHASNVNHVMGLLPGAVNGFLYIIIIAALLLTLPVSETISATAKDSKIASTLSNEIEWLDNKLSPIFSEAAKNAVNHVTVKPDSDETINLHYTVRDASTRPDLEAQMLVLVNNERTQRGLPPLKADPELTKVARAHSNDMFVRGYFSHYSPEKKDPFDRMKAARVRFLSAGENLALGQSLSICHTGLMNSPGHRANILHKSFGRVGIGILDGGLRGLMISQEFRN
jgi:uncharacterized protein YkwD